jgi:hypothetical protein
MYTIYKKEADSYIRMLGGLVRVLRVKYITAYPIYYSADSEIRIADLQQYQEYILGHVAYTTTYTPK